MPSFDIVSEIDRQEIDNAVNQARKEIITRYDFKGSKSEINLDKDEIHLLSDDDYKMKALIDILQTKSVKRGINLKSFEIGKIEPAGGQSLRCTIKLLNGVSTDRAKELVKKIKELELKVQPSIDGDKVRVSAKKRDDLQVVIQSIRGFDFPIPLQFNNFRD